MTEKKNKTEKGEQPLSVKIRGEAKRIVLHERGIRQTENTKNPITIEQVVAELIQEYAALKEKDNKKESEKE